MLRLFQASIFQHDGSRLLMATPEGTVRTLNGVLVKVRPGEVVGGMVRETAGGVDARVEQLATKLAQQEEAVTALKREVDELRQAMTNAEAAKGAAAEGALETGRHGETVKGKVGAGGAAARDAGEAGEAGKAEDRLSAQPSEGRNTVPLLESFIGEHVDRFRSEHESEVEGLKEQVEAVRREAAGAASALRAEIARVRAAAERQAAEVAYVRATAAHTEARMNDLELAVAEWKSAREKEGAESSKPGGRAGEQAGAERREGKRRKRDEGGKAVTVAPAAAGGCALIEDCGAADGKAADGERKADLPGLRAVVDGLRCRVVKLEKSSGTGGRVWENSAATNRNGPQRHILPHRRCPRSPRSFRQLANVTLEDSSGFTAEGVRKLFSLPALVHLDLTGSCTTDAALEGIDRVKTLRNLVLDESKITDVGVARLGRLTALVGLHLGGCVSVTSASMVHVGKLTALEELSLHDGGVREDGLLHLTSLTSLNYLILPPGVTDSGMKYLRNMKRLVKLGMWDAKITANGVNWLKGLPCLQKIGADAEDVEGFIRDTFPGMVVTPGLL
ncbi:unnamed protein product [Closterium sp. Yama58-4]|nr:unnamed protein product [Closterium sp. Yama58-4]